MTTTQPASLDSRPAIRRAHLSLTPTPTPALTNRFPSISSYSQGLGVNPDNELQLAVVLAALLDVGEDVGLKRAQHLVREGAQGLKVAACQSVKSNGSLERAWEWWGTG